jgi:oxygen-independent coproporphyrinogen-3 oxidase
MTPGPAPGLYVHIPVCRAKCPYCDFYSVVAPQRAEVLAAALLDELALAGAGWPAFDSLYIGGGSPSALAPAVLERLLIGLRRWLAAGAEITVELNPADIGDALLAVLAAAGVDRISLGVQAFSDDRLRWLGRRHDAATALRAAERIRAAGFAALGLDLIWGLPGDGPDRWQRELRAALALEPEHLSCYELTLSPHSPLGRRRSRGAFDLPDEVALAALFMQADELLGAAGYAHYEVSNYARGRRRRSRHNQKYWRRAPVLGLGPAAHSFDGRRRWANPADLEGHLAALAAGRRPAEPGPALAAEQVRLERLALGLRTSDGIPADLPPDRPAVRASIDRLLAAGLLTRRGRRLRPTSRGLLLADAIAERLSG